MRANNAYDREGNSYRFARHNIRMKEEEERVAQSKKWDDFYEKVCVKSRKPDKSPKK